MMMRLFNVFAILCIAITCSLLEAKSRPGLYSDPDLDELRIEVEDLKQALHTTQVDLSLLDEKGKKQESSLGRHNTDSATVLTLLSQVAQLEKKVSSLEKLLNTVATDLRTLNTVFEQTTKEIHQVETRLSSQDERLNEVGKLKGTLSSIAKAVRENPTSNTSSQTVGSKTYRVKMGDSLEKIAKQHHTTIDALRKLNNLSGDKILVGQEIKVGDDL